MLNKKTIAGLVCSAAVCAVSFGAPSAAQAAVNPFASVPQSSGYYDDIEALVDNGLIYGYEKGEFKKSRLISRMEMAIFTAKAMSAMEQAGPEDTARIQRLMNEFKNELSDMHVEIPGAKAKTETKKDESVKIKRMPENFDVSGMIRFRHDWGSGHYGNGKEQEFGGTSNNRLLWQIFTKFGIGGGWTGEIDFVGEKDSDGNSRNSGENTTGIADVNKVYVLGPGLGGTFRLGRVKGSMVYGDSMIMNEYYEGIDFLKKFDNKWKAGVSWGKVDYVKGDKTFRSDRGVSSNDMNPSGLGVNMTQAQVAYQASKDFSVIGGLWHLSSRGGESEIRESYGNPTVGEIGFNWNASRKLSVLGRIGKSSWDPTGDGNKIYGLTFRWGQVKVTDPHSSRLQIDLLHADRYSSIKSSYDLRNKPGEGQRGFIIDYRYVPVKNIMLDFRWMHYKTIGSSNGDMGNANQYRVQANYYF